MGLKVWPQPRQRNLGDVPDRPQRMTRRLSQRGHDEQSRSPVMASDESMPNDEAVGAPQEWQKGTIA